MSHAVRAVQYRVRSHRQCAHGWIGCTWAADRHGWWDVACSPAHVGAERARSIVASADGWASRLPHHVCSSSLAAQPLGCPRQVFVCMPHAGSTCAHETQLPTALTGFKAMAGCAFVIMCVNGITEGGGAHVGKLVRIWCSRKRERISGAYTWIDYAPNWCMTLHLTLVVGTRTSASICSFRRSWLAVAQEATARMMSLGLCMMMCMSEGTNSSQHYMLPDAVGLAIAEHCMSNRCWLAPSVLVLLCSPLLCSRLFWPLALRPSQTLFALHPPV